MQDFLGRLLLAALALILPGAVVAKPPLRSANSALALPFELDAGRILVEATFRTPEGGARKALAWFNMGMKAPILAKALYGELGIGEGQSLKLAVGDLVLEAPAESVSDKGDGADIFAFPQYFGPFKVEAMLPASLFLAHRLTLDYRNRQLVIDADGRKTPAGVAVPIDLNPDSGLASVEAEIDGRSYAFVIDAGSGYSWMRGETLQPWLVAHPEWRKAEGAIGAANYNMLDLPLGLEFEKRGTIARLPALRLGALEVKDVGVLGSAHGGLVDAFVGNYFWDNWQKAAASPVVGWFGPNVLRRYALTLDYPARRSYWREVADADAHDLDSIGVTLVRRGERYFVGGLVDTPARLRAEGVAVGDELLAVDGMRATGAARGALIAALHGKPGERRRLLLSRDGSSREVELPIMDMR
jgi:hypothetical protein